MDEFNPYAPPRSQVSVTGSLPSASPGFAAYLLVNGLYAGVMLLALLILLRSGTLRAEFSHLLVVAIFLAPLFSCALVYARRGSLFRRWRWVQGVGSGVLLLFCFLDITEGRGLRGIGVFMTLANALALFVGEHFLRLRQSSPTGAGPVAKPGRNA